MFERPQEPKTHQIDPETIHKFEELDSISQAPLRTNPKEKQGEIVSETFYFFKDFFEQNGFHQYTDVSAVYSALPESKYIVRREDPRKIFALFDSQDGYSVDFKDDRYANCAVWQPQADGPLGLHNAYLEG